MSDNKSDRSIQFAADILKAALGGTGGEPGQPGQPGQTRDDGLRGGRGGDGGASLGSGRGGKGGAGGSVRVNVVSNVDLNALRALLRCIKVGQYSSLQWQADLDQLAHEVELSLSE